MMIKHAIGCGRSHLSMQQKLSSFLTQILWQSAAIELGDFAGFSKPTPERFEMFNEILSRLKKLSVTAVAEVTYQSHENRCTHRAE
jgi:hypothetical protein